MGPISRTYSQLISWRLSKRTSIDSKLRFLLQNWLKLCARCFDSRPVYLGPEQRGFEVEVGVV